ncbi:MAG: hypothetical protein ACO3C1_03920 [Ilumatobacteraceae bacterium]
MKKKILIATGVVVAVFVAAAFLVNLKGPTEPTAFWSQLSGDDVASSRSGTVTGSDFTPCPASLDVAAVGDISVCRLRATESAAAYVSVRLDTASAAKRTRIIYLCDYTLTSGYYTSRSNIWQNGFPYESANEFLWPPQCSSNTAKQVRFDPDNLPSGDSVKGTFEIRVPSGDEAYGMWSFLYQDPSVLVAVVDYDPAKVSPTLPPG